MCVWCVCGVCVREGEREALGPKPAGCLTLALCSVENWSREGLGPRAEWRVPTPDRHAGRWLKPRGSGLVPFIKQPFSHRKSFIPPSRETVVKRAKGREERERAKMYGVTGSARENIQKERP